MIGVSETAKSLTRFCARGTTSTIDNMARIDIIKLSTCGQQLVVCDGRTDRVSAFPDVSTVIEDIREEGDGLVSSHLGGTFTNDFDLAAMGMGVIPATGAALDFPTTTFPVSFYGDKISKPHDPDTGPDAGMTGFLKALGAEKG
jgi:hypothetical protein